VLVFGYGTVGTVLLAWALGNDSLLWIVVALTFLGSACIALVLWLRH
jgi:hypothetical protein